MAFKVIFTGILLALWLAAGVLLFWLPARMAPPPVSAGPEVPSRRGAPGRGARAAAFGVISLVLAGVIAGIATAEFAPVSVDFDSDVWVAECGGSFARDSFQRKKRHSRTLRYGSFTGASTLWQIYLPGERELEIPIEYEISVEEGRGDLALVYPDGAVVRLSGERSPYLLRPGKGTTRLRLIGDEGRMEVSVTISSMDGNWMAD